MDYFAAMGAFVRSVELGSFSKVASESGMKVSTVSRYVAALESDLGAALFNRTTRRLKLTEAGNVFYSKAAQVLADLEEARQTTSSLNGRPQGVLRINIPSAFGRRHIMPFVKEFLERYPEITLDATLTDLTVDLLETGTDLAVRIGAQHDSTLIAKRLSTQRRLLVAAPEYLEAYGTPKSPDELSEHECLTFTVGHPVHWYMKPINEPGTIMQEISVSGHLRTNDTEALRDATITGQGVALLPTWLIADDLRANRLTPLMVEMNWNIAADIDSPIWGVYAPKKVVSPKVRVFLDFIMQRLGTPPYWENI